MTKTDHKISAADAREALKSIAEANKTTANSMRPPLWLTLLCSGALGLATIGMGLMIDNTLWNGIKWGVIIVAALSAVPWISALKLRGISITLVDVHITNKGLLSALIICALLASSRVMYLQTGLVLLPCIAGLLNTAVLAYNLHFGLRLNANDKGENS